MKVVDGDVIKTTSTVHGRRLPLAYNRKKLLDKHAQYMHLLSDEAIALLPEAELKVQFTHLHEPVDSMEVHDLRELLKTLQRSRTISLWHDHSSILGQGYIVMAVQVVYDLAVFMTDAEYLAASGKKVSNLQHMIEEPELYIVALCSSSATDQLAIIPDRLADLHELSGYREWTKPVLCMSVTWYVCSGSPVIWVQEWTKPVLCMSVTW